MNRLRAPACRSQLWLAVGLGLFLVSHGRWTVPVCSWFAFVFLIRYHRTTPRPRLGILALWLGMSACHAVMYDGLLPVRGLAFAAACLLVGGTWAFPFVLDRLLYRRLDGLAATLLWPLMMVTIHYFLAAYLPSLALSQGDYLSLIQLVSVTGTGGLVFLIYWVAGALNRVWEAGFGWPSVRRDGGLVLGALGLVVVSGEARLAFASSPPESVQVAMINLQRNRLDRLDHFEPRIIRDLFAASKQAAGAGATVIVWAEANADIPASYESELVELGRAFARDNRVFLVMSFRSFSTPGRNENKTVGIAPDGEVVVVYLKSNPIPVLEAGTTPGGGEVATADVGGVRTGHVICYDLDFPSFVRQAGRRGVDVLLAPSGDWREVRFFHAASARFRAVENGCSLVRPTIQGLSIATDPYGRVLAYHDYYSTASRLTLVGVPARGVRTVYAACGDLFSIICIVLFVGLIGVAGRTGAVTRGGPTNPPDPGAGTTTLRVS